MMRLALSLALLALLLLPSVGWSQNTNTLPPLCTATTIADGSCVPVLPGVRAYITDGDDTNNDCTGGGTSTRICEYSGSAWIPVTAGTPVGSFGDSIVNDTDGVFGFTRDENGTVFLESRDNSANSGILLRQTGVESVDLGNSSTTSTTITTDGLVVGADTNNTNTLSLENLVSGSVILDMRDYADTTDDDMAHTSLSTNCTTATTGAEDCDLTVQAVEAGAALTRLVIDADGDTTFAPEPADGGNGNLQHQIVGIPKIAGFSVGTGNTGGETTNVDFGDSETPDTDWTQTANMTTADDSSIFRKGTASLRVTVGATPSAGNGVDNALGTGDQDWSADESFGLWHRCDTTYDAGDWVLGITDNASEDVTTTFPAYATADTWVWVELEIGSIADADKDVITDIAIDLSAAGATTFAAGGICYFDYLWKWDAAEELALSADIYEDGILSMFSVITAGAAITPILEVEGTDFFVHYETGNDFIVPVTDLSNDSLWGMAALE